VEGTDGSFNDVVCFLEGDPTKQKRGEAIMKRAKACEEGKRGRTWRTGG